MTISNAQKAAQLVFPGFKFGLDDPAEALRLADLGVGGFCLYGGEAREVAELTARLQARALRPLLFCADYEDGTFSQCPGGTPLPSNMGLGASGRAELVFEKARITAVEARAMGVRWVLAPVVDLATCPANPIVNVRAFSKDPAEAARLARAYLRGAKSAQALSCLKHFPGHGETLKDSHRELPTVGVSRAILSRRELAPYRDLAGEADAVMTGHLRVPALLRDSKLPYSLSPDVAKTLRRGLGFQGLVMSDALTMQAVARRYEDLEAARLALLGGSDIVLVPSRPRDLVLALGQAADEDAALGEAVATSFRRVEKARGSIGLGTNVGASGEADLAMVGSGEHREAAERMAESCLAWAGPPAPLGPGQAVLYWEPEEPEPEHWAGKEFVGELRRGGVRVKEGRGNDPHRNADDQPEAGARLIIGVYLTPRAYLGRIQLGRAQAARARRALARAKLGSVVSFGSPFVFADLKARGLCAFSPYGPAQRAAARALIGRVAAGGRMPA